MAGCPAKAAYNSVRPKRFSDIPEARMPVREVYPVEAMRLNEPHMIRYHHGYVTAMCNGTQSIRGTVCLCRVVLGQRKAQTCNLARIKDFREIIRKTVEFELSRGQKVKLWSGRVGHGPVRSK
jgi:hypothetical protein